MAKAELNKEATKKLREDWKQCEGAMKAAFEQSAALDKQRYEKECAAAGLDPNPSKRPKVGDAAASAAAAADAADGSAPLSLAQLQAAQALAERDGGA